MKVPLLPTLALSTLFFASIPAFAQEAAEPAAGTPAVVAKPKPLGSADKSFVKNALEDTYTLLSLCEKKRLDQLNVADTKAVGTRISTELTDLWAELGPVATANGVALPEVVNAGDKSKIDHLEKAALGKFDKEWIKLVTKETKHLAGAFATAAKSSDPQIKTIAAKWAPITKAQNDDAEKAEKLAAKTK